MSRWKKRKEQAKAGGTPFEVPKIRKASDQIHFKVQALLEKNACSSMFQLVLLSRLSHPVFSWNVWTL